MGQFPDLLYRLALGRASGCKNFCLKKSLRKWGTSGHPHGRGREWIKIGLLLLHLSNRYIEKTFDSYTVHVSLFSFLFGLHKIETQCQTYVVDVSIQVFFSDFYHGKICQMVCYLFPGNH